MWSVSKPRTESVADVVREQGSTAEKACGCQKLDYSLWVPEIVSPAPDLGFLHPD